MELLNHKLQFNISYPTLYTLAYINHDEGLEKVRHVYVRDSIISPIGVFTIFPIVKSGLNVGQVNSDFLHYEDKDSWPTNPSLEILSKVL